ncbi:MAG: helix-turn-helix domain-containing protein [Proteobacteria bacterium]|nr:helix-turn-helix domain-containing protein [Pseudomonadota bacterium]
MRIIAMNNPNTGDLMDWHPAQVKMALEMEGTNLAKLARDHGYAHINDVLSRHWVAAELIVAKALGKKAEEIWPSRYARSRERAKALTRNAQVRKKFAGALKQARTQS